MACQDEPFHMATLLALVEPPTEVKNPPATSTGGSGPAPSGSHEIAARTIPLVPFPTTGIGGPLSHPDWHCPRASAALTAQTTATSNLTTLSYDRFMNCLRVAPKGTTVSQALNRSARGND
jgi:hypothetical protein